MTPAPVIRLHPDDGVLIARSSLPAGLVVAEGVTTVERIPAGHKVAIRPIAVGRTHPPLRPDHRLCDAADLAGPARAHPELRHGRFRQGLRLRRRREAGAELRPAGDVRWHSPAGRAGRDPQLYRHPHVRELQRACGRHGRRRLQEESVHRRQSARRLSQCRRRGRAHPQDRLRHDAKRAADVAAPDARRLCAARQFFRRRRAGPGLRGQPDRRVDGRAETRRAPARTRNSGNRRHPQDGRGRRRLCA